MNNVLIKTTFKDHLVFLKPFYKFYKKYWNPRTFIFYIGYTYNDSKDIIKVIEDKFNEKISLINNYQTNIPYANKIEIYNLKNMVFVLYKTVQNMEANIFNMVLRPKLYNLPNR